MNHNTTDNPDNLEESLNSGNDATVTNNDTENIAEETTIHNTENASETALNEDAVVEENDAVVEEPVSKDKEIIKLGESVHDDLDDDADDEDIEDEEASEEEAEEFDASSLNKQELVAYVDKVLKEDKILQRVKNVSAARDRFQEIFEGERKKALEEFLAIEGNVEMDFQYTLQYIDRQWREVLRNFNNRKRALREAIVVERETNLKKKNALLEELRELTEKATENDAFERVIALQKQWREIGQVPAADLKTLNDNYRFLNDKFFQERSLIKEFLDYDRKKNLDAKNDIIAQINQLVEGDDDLREMMRHYRQLMDAWRDAGPVPKENLDEVMTSFRAANDKITEKKNALIEVVDAERKENIVKKEAIIAKVLELTDDDNDSSWSKRNKALGTLIEEWKKVGGVPRSENQRIRKEFTDAVKVFNKLKNTFFKEQKREKMANLELRLEAIKKVEEILAREGDLRQYRNDVIQIQKYWKTLGHVPRKQSEELWHKFRSTCNSFFDKLKEGDKAKIEEQETNFKLKEEICAEIEVVAEKEGVTADDLAPFEEKWRAIGFVPYSKKTAIETRYREAKKKVLVQTVKMGDVAPHLTDYKLKIEEMMRDSNANRTLDQEQMALRKKIQKQNDELNTLETNIQFFSNSKGADKLVAPIKKQIESIRVTLKDLKEKQALLKKSVDLLNK
ncbi:MAG: DUF349 domain-containing protein [Bacteroidia bacterium]